MKERPILFNAQMVRAILDGRKTQTRRVMKPQPDSTHDGEPYWFIGGYRAWRFTGTTAILRIGSFNPISSPYGKTGDRLWVRETFAHQPAEYEWSVSTSVPARPDETWYRADFANGESFNATATWKPSIHMPRSLSRITLEITGVRVERLQEISIQDAMAEGVAETAPRLKDLEPCMEWRYAYEDLWKVINGPGSWDANPWVWVIAFKRVMP